MKSVRLLVLAASAALTLTAQNQTQIGADFSSEKAHFDESCLSLKVADCAQLLFTGHPLHIAAGSLAPQNGFGTGLALVLHHTPNERWRLSWDFDAVATPNASWRAGAYMTAVLIRQRQIVVRSGSSADHLPKSKLTVDDMPVFHVYAQGISLNKLYYFGLGQGTSNSMRSDFGMSESIVGANVVWPVGTPLALSLFGEANGHFDSVRNEQTGGVPAITQLYNETTAPGLTGPGGFAQLGEGARIRPNFAGGHVRLNYALSFEEWARPSSSFRRLRVDLAHTFPLYSRSTGLPAHQFNGPDDCSISPTEQVCPSITRKGTRNLEGSLGFQFLYTASFASSTAAIPFVFDPTLGGSDVNGTMMLGSYPDYRFRGPNLMLLRGTFEHSIGKLPLGAKVMLDEGRVAVRRGDLGFNHLAHSYAAGLTVHAGGLPVFDLLFAWGGHQGTHTIATVSPTLLGGAARPSLF